METKIIISATSEETRMGLTENGIFSGTQQ